MLDSALLASEPGAKKEMYVKTIVECFQHAKSFAISENNIIVWSRRNIFHGNLKKMRDRDMSHHLILQESQFQINSSASLKDKKASKYFKRTVKDVSVGENSAEDYIDDIICRNKIYQAK